ncbi:MAG: T9SS C-terminal target domain-containing protein, partial [Calditrichaeota bacterium]
LPVWGADLYLHYNAAGELSVMNGRYQPTPSGTEFEFTLTEQAALSRAAQALQIPLESAHIWTAEQVIYVDEKGRGIPAWHIEMGATMFDDMRFIIDGRNSEILESYNNIQTGSAAKGTGTDLLGQSRSLDLYKVGSNYYLLNTTKGMFDGNTTDEIASIQGVILVGDARNVEPDQFNYYYYTASTSTSSWPANGVSLAYSFSRVYDYFKNVHGLVTLDNARHNIIGITNIGNQYNNAFWSGGIKMFCFGNGDGQVFIDLAASFDIIAHEYGHGVTQYSSNLEYQFQSGALNEAFSDFVGVMAENYVDPANADWRIGEDCLPAGSTYNCLRDLSNPHQPKSLTSDYPNKMAEYANWTIDQDNGGVHRNSTIPGHAFYQMSTRMAVDRVEKIIYRAYLNYLTRRSEFIDLRLAAVQAAKDLYPGDNTATLTGQSFDIVEVYTGEETEPDPPFEPVEGDDFVLALFEGSGEMFKIKSDYPWADGNAVSLGITSVSKPSVTDNGQVIVYVDAEGNVNWFDTTENQNYALTDDGIWYNVAISPLGDYIALVPKPESYPSTIAIYDFAAESMTLRALSIPTTTEGAEIIPDYADILDWSTEGGWLIFDCTFALQDSYGAESNTWGIYLTNVSEDAVVPIFQPDVQYAVGNPSFSSTRDNVIAFDVIDYSSDQVGYYVYTYDLFEGQLGLIHQNSGTYGHPSFSPDDRKMVFQDQTTINDELVSSLWQIELQADGLTPSSEGAKAWVYPLEYPVWYAEGTRPSNVETVFAEQFDQETFPPNGWLAPDMPAHADYGWRQGNVDDHNFSDIEPDNVASVICGYNPAAMQVDRFYSPAFNVASSETQLTFWAGYNFSWTSNYQVNLYLTSPNSMDAAATLWQIKNEGNDGGQEWSWHQVTVDLGGYAGQKNVRLFWEYRGKDGDLYALDGIQLTNRGGAAVETDDHSALPELTIIRNYPNPFNGETLLTYTLAKDGPVTIEIYNLSGQLVQTIVQDEFQESGTFQHKWKAEGVGSGVYFYRLVTIDGVYSGKSVVIQ